MNFVTAKIDSVVCLNFRRVIRALGAIVVLLVFSLPVFSQANQGTIQGNVFDQTGGAIAGATVTVIDVARGVSKPLTTDSAGAYVAPNLIPGTFTVRGEAKGFQVLEHANVALQVGQTVRVDLILQPGAQTQTITVTGEAPTVNTSDATLGGEINQDVLTSLPMNGRDFKNVVSMIPGITALVGGGGDTWQANGTRAEDVGYLLDGLRADEAYTGQSLVNSNTPAGGSATLVPIDAIQEINNEENPKAEVGWKPGAIVNVGLKSGTNDIHGTAIAFGRDTALDARNFFDSFQPGTETPLPKQSVAFEQFGATAGGRIVKDKLFWFAGYEGQRYTVSETVSQTTPATVDLPGGYTGSTNGIANSKLSLVDACLAANAAAKTITPLSAQLAGLNTTTCAVAPANYTPGPTESLYPANPGTAAIFLNLLSQNQEDNGLIKLDYHLSDHNAINGMYFNGRGYADWNLGNVGIPGSSLSPFGSIYGPIKDQLVTASWNWTPSSTRINEFRFGYVDYSQIYESTDHAVNPLQYGIDTGVTDPRVYGLPGIAITGFSSLGGGQAKLVGPDSAPGFLDHYSILHGSHTIKFGGEYIYNDVNVYSNSAGKGTIKFSNLTNFLEGTVSNNGDKIQEGNLTRHLTNDLYSLFVQDDWRATRKIIFNLGLRWEYSSVLKEANNQLGEFDPNQGLVQVGKQITSPYNGNFKNFSPRVGLAWDIQGNGRTVLRAGSSVMYSYLPILDFNAVANQIGLTQVPTGVEIVDAACPGGCSGAGTINTINKAVPGTVVLQPAWRNQTQACVSGGTTVCNAIFPVSLQCGDGITQYAPGGVPSGTTPIPCIVASVNRNLPSPYLITWSLGVQRAFTHTLSIDVSYVGNHGANQAAFLDINQAAFGSGFTALQIAAGDPSVASTAAEQLTRPYDSKYPYLSYIDQLTDVDRSNYNALQVTLTQRTWHGVSFLAGYTYAHALDDASTNYFSSIPPNSNNPGLQYGASDWDIRNRLTFTTTYNLPGKKAPLQLLEGWQINSVVTLQGGMPWSARDTSNDVSGTGEVNNLDAYHEGWNFAGNTSDFTSGPSTIPCWSGSGGAALAGCTILGSIPAACMTAASALGANTLASTESIGCYVKGNSVMFPAALGTLGDAGRNIFRDSGFRNWDLSVTKGWKFKERYNAQFRAEFFNILNHPSFGNPGGLGAGAGYNDPSGGASGFFGCGCVTPDQAAPNPVLGSGANRSVQLGLKLSF